MPAFRRLYDRRGMKNSILQASMSTFHYRLPVFAVKSQRLLYSYDTLSLFKFSVSLVPIKMGFVLFSDCGEGRLSLAWYAHLLHR